MSLSNLSSPHLSSKFQQTLCWAALAVAAISAATLIGAQSVGLASAEEPASGRIVPIAPGGAGAVMLDDALDAATQTVTPQGDAPKYWVGTLLGPVSEEVRAQINLPAEQGVLVRLVVPKGPAAQAGIEQFDIILTANGKPVVTGLELMELVQQAGASGDKITLDVLRRGEHKSIELTPAERPASDDAGAGSAQGWGSGGAMTGMPGMPNFGPGGPHLRMRVPGSAFGQGLNLNQMPSNFSVSVQKNNDEPAHITVKRGNDTWEVVGDDPKSLEQLPDDVRPFVEQMLSGGSTMPLTMPGMPGMNRMRGVDRMPGMWGPTGFDNDAMQQQLQRMEEQLQQMRMQLQQDLAPQGQPSASPILPAEPDDSTESEAN